MTFEKKNGLETVETKENNKDSRTDNIIPFVNSLSFLKQEAKKNGHAEIHDLIDSVFKIILIAYDITGDKRN